MNLGQLIGEQKLRIWQLEDELESRNIRIVATNTSAPPASPESPHAVRLVETGPAVTHRRGMNRGIGARVRAALPLKPPGLTVSEIAARLGDIRSQTVSAFLCQFDDVAHTGEWRHYRYYRKAAA